jgi:hypothetical protein
VAVIVGNTPAAQAVKTATQGRTTASRHRWRKTNIINRRQAVLGRQRYDPLAFNIGPDIRQHDQPAIWYARE